MGFGCKQQNEYFGDKSNLLQGYWVTYKINCRLINQAPTTCKNHERLCSRKCLCGAVFTGKWALQPVEGFWMSPFVTGPSPPLLLQDSWCHCQHEWFLYCLHIFASNPLESKSWMGPPDWPIIGLVPASLPLFPAILTQQGPRELPMFSKMRVMFEYGRLK